MGCLILCTLISFLVVVGLLWLATTFLRDEARRVDQQVQSAHRQLFDLTTQAFRSMVEEAQQQRRGGQDRR